MRKLWRRSVADVRLVGIDKFRYQREQPIGRRAANGRKWPKAVCRRHPEIDRNQIPKRALLLKWFSKRASSVFGLRRLHFLVSSSFTCLQSRRGPHQTVYCS